MSTNLSRRSAIAAGISIVGGVLSGCIQSRSTSQTGGTQHDIQKPRDETIEITGWPQLAHDAWNTSFNPHTTGPQSDVEIDWTISSNNFDFFQPIVTDAAYVTESGTAGTMYAVERSDGSVRWMSTSLSPMRWPATVHENRVLVITRNEDNEVQLHAFDRSDGSELWSTIITASSSNYPPLAPTVIGDRVFLPSDTGVAALAIETGKWHWTADLAPDVVYDEGVTRKTTWATPAVRGTFVYTFDRNETVGTQRRVYALDRETGDRVWTKTLTVPQRYWRFNNHVVAGERHLFVTISGSEPQGGGSDKKDEDEPTQQGGGRLFALDPGSGDIQWTFDLDGSARVPALTNRTLYVPLHIPETDENQVVAIQTDGKNTRWKKTFDGVINGVAAAEGTVFVNGDGIEAVEEADGTRIWQKLTGHNVGTPVVARDRVYATYAPEGTNDLTKIAAFREQ